MQVILPVVAKAMYRRWLIGAALLAAAGGLYGLRKAGEAAALGWMLGVGLALVLIAWQARNVFALAGHPAQDRQRLLRGAAGRFASALVLLAAAGMAGVPMAPVVGGLATAFLWFSVCGFAAWRQMYREE